MYQSRRPRESGAVSGPNTHTIDDASDGLGDRLPEVLVDCPDRYLVALLMPVHWFIPST